MQHNELLDTMMHTITVEREALPPARSIAASGQGKDRFILSGLSGGQLEAVKQYIASFRLNA